jgi:acetylornithine deacetylase
MPLDATRAILADLIGFPTVSADGNLELIAYAQSRLDAIGGSTQMTVSPCGRKANLFATIGPDAPGGVVLSGHTDVVPAEGQDWSSDPFEAVEAEGRIHGRGACDMKGFIACALAMAPRFADAALARPLHLALTYDEEVGCLGAPVLIDAIREAGVRPAACIVGEPTEMRVVEGHKGMCEYTTRLHGLAGHGSDPGAGVSAVEYALRYGARLLALREALRARAPPGSRFAPPETTLQIGRLAGGSSHNVIAEQAELDWELRPVVPEDRDFVLAEMARFADEELLPEMRAVHPGAAIETETVGDVTGLAPMPDSEAVRLAAALTGGNETALVAFGTEAGLFQAAGIPTVVCGPGSIHQAHKADEYVELAQLRLCLGMIERLIPRLAGA